MLFIVADMQLDDETSLKQFFPTTQPQPTKQLTRGMAEKASIGINAKEEHTGAVETHAVPSEPVARANNITGR